MTIKTFSFLILALLLTNISSAEVTFNIAEKGPYAHFDYNMTLEQQTKVLEVPATYDLKSHNFEIGSYTIVFIQEKSFDEKTKKELEYLDQTFTEGDVKYGVGEEEKSLFEWIKWLVERWLIQEEINDMICSDIKYALQPACVNWGLLE